MILITGALILISIVVMVAGLFIDERIALAGLALFATAVLLAVIIFLFGIISFGINGF